VTIAPSFNSNNERDISGLGLVFKDAEAFFEELSAWYNEDKMVCAKCKTENPDGLKFCNECGAAFSALCASCGFENAPTAKFCGQCGKALGAPAAALARKSDDRQDSGSRHTRP